MFGLDFNQTVSLLTSAGLTMFIILNADKAATLFKGISDAASSYLKTFQIEGGRPK